MKILAGFAVVVLGISCMRTTTTGQVGGGSHSGLSMSFSNLDDKTRSALSGYAIQIDKVGDCKFDIIRKLSKTPFADGQKELTLNEKVQKNCSYLIKLSFGKFDEQSKKLTEIYYTNIENAQKGTELIVKDEADVRAQVKVNITEAGIKAGLGQPGGSIDSDSDLGIDVDFDGDNDDADDSPADIASSINTFAFDFVSRLGSSQEFNGKNLFVSPSSLYLALAMTYAGADGTTLSAMSKSMGLGLDQRANLKKIGTFANNIKSDRTIDGHQLSIANRIWSQENFGFTDAFLALNQDHLGSTVEERDFVDNAARSAAIADINQWAADNTEQRIKNIVGPSDITSDTRIVLANAIYFLGDWVVPFPKYDFPVPARDFTLADGKVVKTELMTTEDPVKLNYFEDNKMAMVELPYKTKDQSAGASVSMLIMVPKAEADQGGLGALLDPAYYAQASASMKPELVGVTIPKFEQRGEAMKLKGTLAAMGMDVLFKPYKPQDDAATANFAKMNGKRDVFISEVVQKTFIKVDENGTEAAAVTTVLGATTTSVGPNNYKRFSANKPFVYFIRDNKTGAILFAGRLMNPNI